MMSLRLAVLGSLIQLALAASNNWTCKKPSNQPDMNPLNYCVHVQSKNAPSGGSWPVMVFLPGSGARTSDFNKAQEYAQYDGMGKAIYQYYSGQKTDQTTQAAEQFLTIIPVAGDGARHFMPGNIQAILDEVAQNYNVDKHRHYLSGYSMGSRGCFRNGVHDPDKWAAIAPSAGGAERPGDGTLTQQAAVVSTYDQLKNIVHIPLRQFAGSSDTTAGTDSPKATQQKLEELGSKVATLEIMNTDHSGLSTKPWLETDLLSWFLKQSTSGSSKVSSNASSAPSASSKPSRTPVAAKPSASAAHKSSSPATTQNSNDDDEECEEDDETTTSTDDEDCEEDDDDDDADEEDCDDDEDVKSSSNKASSNKTSSSDDEDCDDEADDIVPVKKRAIHHRMRFTHAKRGSIHRYAKIQRRAVPFGKPHALRR